MMKKGVIKVIVFSLLLSIVSACGIGGSSGKTEVSKEKENIGIYKMPNVPVELFIVSSSGDSLDSFNDRFLNLVQNKFPNVKFTYLPWLKTGPSIQDMITAGQQIDIYFDSLSAYSLSSYGAEMDMSDLIKKHNIDLGSLEPSTVQGVKAVSSGKEMWGVPVFNNNLVLYYNKDIFNKFGVPFPKQQMTWDEMIELSRKLGRIDGDKGVVGYTTSANHALRMNQMSLSYLDPKTMKSGINNENWKKFYETIFLDSYKAAGLEAFTSKNNRMPNFLTEEAAMFMYLSSAMFINKEYDTINWDMVPIPTMKEKPGVGSQPYPSIFSVTNTSKHKDEATEVIKYLISEEAQLLMSKKGIMPVLNKDSVKAVFGQESKFKDRNLKAVFTNKFAEVPLKTKYDGKVEGAYNAATSDAIKTDINTALRTAEEKANQIIAEVK